MSHVVRSLLAIPLAAFCLLSLAATEAPAPQVSPETAATLRERLAILVNNAVTKNAFDDMLSSLSKTNRDRIAEVPFSNHDRVNSALKRLRASYKANYSRDLAISPDAFSELTFYVDQDPDHARAVSSTHSLTLQLTRETYIANRWRLHLTNPTADSLADSLATRLDSLAATRWPRDPAAAQRQIALAVLDSLATARSSPVVNASSR
jgi:hypothetical protein